MLQDNIGGSEDLSYAKTTEKTFHREVPVGVGVGTQDWAVSCVSKLSTEQRLARLEENFDDVKKDLRDLKQDSLLWATVYLKNVASEALLCGDQPPIEPPRPTHRFRNLANKNDSRLATYASLARRPDPMTLGPILDGVIDRRNSTVHFRDVQGLREAVQHVQGLLARHPELRRRCKDEVMIIDSFDDLTVAFSL